MSGVEILPALSIAANVMQIIGFIMLFMLTDKRYERPEISDVNDWLSSTGGHNSIYHGPCCPIAQHCHIFSSRNDLWRTEIEKYLPTNNFDEQERILNRLELSATKWSGTGSSFDVDYHELSAEFREELKASRGQTRGAGDYREVKQVVCERVPMADKKFLGAGGVWLKVLKNEHCDLDKLLDLCEGLWSSSRKVASDGDTAENLRILRTAAGIHFTKDGYILQQEVIAILMRLMGCLAETMQWMHYANMAIGDLKPKNILLRRGMLFVNPSLRRHIYQYFSEETTEKMTEDSIIELFTQGYAAPAIAAEDGDSPFSPEVFSVGAIYLHMISVIYGASRRACSEILSGPSFRREKDIRDHLRKLALSSTALDMNPLPELSLLIEAMLRNEAFARPTMAEVNRTLREFGGPTNSYHHECCANAIDVSNNEDSTPKTPNLSSPLGRLAL